MRCVSTVSIPLVSTEREINKYTSHNSSNHIACTAPGVTLSRQIQVVLSIDLSPYFYATRAYRANSIDPGLSRYMQLLGDHWTSSHGG